MATLEQRKKRQAKRKKHPVQTGRIVQVLHGERQGQIGRVISMSHGPGNVSRRIARVKFKYGAIGYYRAKNLWALNPKNKKYKNRKVYLAKDIDYGELKFKNVVLLKRFCDKAKEELNLDDTAEMRLPNRKSCLIKNLSGEFSICLYFKKQDLFVLDAKESA